MCTGAILLYGIPRVVIGENRTFYGGEDYLRSRGVEVVNLDSRECHDLMQRFIAEHRGITAALAAARNRNGKPKAIVLRTLPGKGVRRIEESEKSHFFRVDVSQWAEIIADFEQSVGAAR